MYPHGNSSFTPAVYPEFGSSFIISRGDWTSMFPNNKVKAFVNHTGFFVTIATPPCTGTNLAFRSKLWFAKSITCGYTATNGQVCFCATKQALGRAYLVTKAYLFLCHHCNAPLHRNDFTIWLKAVVRHVNQWQQGSRSCWAGHSESTRRHNSESPTCK